MREVVLTDAKGNRTGLSEIVEAHTGKGKLHKAFSVYIFRNKGTEILIQQRSSEKMLFPLIWANTCCSHPFPEEDVIAAGQRRLNEECGLECALQESGTLVYRAEDPSGNGIEHEHVTLLRGDIDDQSACQPESAGRRLEPDPDPEEIAEMRWILLEELLTEMENHPDHYAPWFHLGLKQLLFEL